MRTRLLDWSVASPQNNVWNWFEMWQPHCNEIKQIWLQSNSCISFLQLMYVGTVWDTITYSLYFINGNWVNLFNLYSQSLAIPFTSSKKNGLWKQAEMTSSKSYFFKMLTSPCRNQYAMNLIKVASELSAKIIKESSYDTVAFCQDWQNCMPRWLLKV